MTKPGMQPNSIETAIKAVDRAIEKAQTDGAPAKTHEALMLAALALQQALQSAKLAKGWKLEVVHAAAA